MTPQNHRFLRPLSFLKEPIDDIQTMRETDAVMNILDESEIHDLDFSALGDLVLSLSRSLSLRVDMEILAPLSEWLKDDAWINCFSGHEAVYDWKQYKKKQRQWTKQQKRLAAERLKKYRQQFLQKRQFRSAIQKNRTENQPCPRTELENSMRFMEGIVSPFSRKEQHQRETLRQFSIAASMPLSMLIPWKTILRSQFLDAPQQSLSHIEIYAHSAQEVGVMKTEKVSVLIHLLELASAGEIALYQEEHFGEISIQKKAVRDETEIMIIDTHGFDYRLDWQKLNPVQRSKIIKDIRNNTVFCKSMESK